ncbi:hypothetical protein H310_06546 [Aphanomyces invadans]|uniref:Reverse transcriptase domain-containing protein n=1 Tax=Aphanomyces invadans TaxID=157072 RepID=A0A024U6Z0_9STRA|nr:hypothetical protein H310_06546 [Aphanomyces invadans]ETW02034.1 hypothetical protein H310_06546 [Aphanomyces invadans]|eukprot:XP_008869882.1 hypothetical protein H310_06546 [Aphanomyces invadans]
MYTPSRVLMSQMDAVAYCQSAVYHMFGVLLLRGLLAWLDDLLGAAATPEEKLNLLGQVFEICEAYGLKLHPKRCAFFQRELSSV